MSGVYLVYGGTQFMGLTLMRHFSLQPSETKVILVNRGKSYWDGESEKIVAKQPNRFEHVKADRNLDSFTEKVQKGIDGRTVLAVIDFSCYKLKQAQLGAAVVPTSTKYIYISTDSTYNASGLIED